MVARKLSCPACGAGVEIPASLTRAHCVYCGSEILISPEAEARRATRQDDLEAFLELLRTAMKAQNWADVLRYADRVLELDPRSSFGWYCKGLAMCYLSTWTDDLWEEARTYEDKALEIDPANKEARVMRDEWWPRYYIRYLYYLSIEQWKTAYNVWYTECLASIGWVANRKAAPYAAIAVATLDKALSLISMLPEGAEQDKTQSMLLFKKAEFLKGPPHSGLGDPQPLLRRVRELNVKIEKEQEGGQADSQQDTSGASDKGQEVAFQ